MDIESNCKYLYIFIHHSLLFNLFIIIYKFLCIKIIGCNEEFDDILQLMCPLEISNMELLLDTNYTSFKTTALLERYHGVSILDSSKDESSMGQVYPNRRGRPKVVPALTHHLMRERRDTANARERKRMNQLTRYFECMILCILKLFNLQITIHYYRAYKTLKDHLPNKEKIISKKQIVDQVYEILYFIFLTYFIT